MWTVRGKMKIKGEWVKFTTTVDAPSERLAVEWAYSNLGSRHKVRRRDIVIEEVVKNGEE